MIRGFSVFSRGSFGLSAFRLADNGMGGWDQEKQIQRERVLSIALTFQRNLPVPLSQTSSGYATIGKYTLSASHRLKRPGDWKGAGGGRPPARL